MRLRTGEKILAAALALSASGVGAVWAQTLPDRAIARLMRTPAAELDPGLPSVPFPQWLSATLQPSAQLRWEVGDCGEQTVAPADSITDFSFCVQVGAVLADRRAVTIVIFVGTQQRGLLDPPQVFSVSVQDGFGSRRISQLSQLATALRLTGQSHSRATGWLGEVGT